MDPHFDGVIFKTHPGEVARRMRHPWPPFVILDVRPRDERQQGGVPGSIAVDSSQLASSLPAGTDARTEFFVIGRDQYDEEVRRTSDRLRELGARRIVEITGGMFEWEAFGMPLEKPSSPQAA